MIHRVLIALALFGWGVGGFALGQGGVPLLNDRPNQMQGGAYLWYQQDWSTGQQLVGVLGDPRPATFVQLPRYSSTDAVFTMGDATRPEIALDFATPYNLAKRHAELSWGLGTPQGINIALSGSAQQGIYKSTTGGYWYCGTGATAGSSCIVTAPYLGWNYGVGSSISGYIVATSGTEVFFGQESGSSEALGFYTNGTGNWRGRSTKSGVTNDCDTGLAFASNLRGLFMMIWRTTGIEFYAGYVSTLPIYRCTIALSQVSDPSPPPEFTLRASNPSGGNKELTNTHFHFVWH